MFIVNGCLGHAIVRKWAVWKGVVSLFSWRRLSGEGRGFVSGIGVLGVRGVQLSIVCVGWRSRCLRCIFDVEGVFSLAGSGWGVGRCDGTG